MQQLRTYWQSGRTGKIVLGTAGIVGAFVACCCSFAAFGAVISTVNPSFVSTSVAIATAEPATPAALVPTVAPAVAVAPTNPPQPTSAPSATPAPTRTLEPTALPAPTTVPTIALPAGYVTKVDYGDKWPFTVEEGEVRCLPVRKVVFISEGTTYAVNGTAKNDYPEIAPIWLDNPTIEGLKVNLQPILNLGLSLCQ